VLYLLLAAALLAALALGATLGHRLGYVKGHRLGLATGFDAGFDDAQDKLRRYAEQVLARKRADRLPVAELAAEADRLDPQAVAQVEAATDDAVARYRARKAGSAD
jgi:hypothetical protein